MDTLAAEFAEAEVVTDAGNGRVLAYLNANAEVYRQEFRDDPTRSSSAATCRATCSTTSPAPRVQVRFVERNGTPERNGKPLGEAG